jgi:hypothetical protein
MTAGILLLLGASVLLALLDWKKGWLAVLLVGFLQDAARKVTPGQPVAFVVAAALVFGATAFGMLLARESPRWRWLFTIFPFLRAPAVVFLLLVLVQSIRTALTGGGMLLTGIGLLSYLSPLFALLFSERYCRDVSMVRRFLRLYTAGAVFVGVTVWLAFFGFEPAIFSSIGIDYVYGPGAEGVLRMISGIMRSSEIAAWHLAAGACWLTAEALVTRSRVWQVIDMAAVAALLVAILLTARRKMVAAYGLFLVLFVLLLLWHRGGLGRVGRLILSSVFGGVILFQLLFVSGELLEVVPYLGRGATVLTESTERLWSMTFQQFRIIVSMNGWWGSGAGTGSQGSQYFGGGVERVGSAAEGGLGKVLAELGVPGLLCLLWLAVALMKAGSRILRALRFRPPEEAVPFLAVGSFLAANAAVFFTAHQVFGDPFILILLGWMSGAIFALPRIWFLELRSGEKRVFSTLS